jgi:large subunit ribosomal protein L3
MKFILGKKIGMTQIFDENGKVTPVTLVEAGPCYINQIKTEEKDGYNAVQVVFDSKKLKNTKKPQRGQIEKLKSVSKNLAEKFNQKAPLYFKEFRVEDISGYSIGDEITIESFEEGDELKISGLSKARGFQGVVKRHGFSGFDATHGTKHGERIPGSIGSAFPERVWPGKKMAGRMGGRKNTVTGLKIVNMDKEDNVLAVKGALPGRKGTLLEIKK